MRPIRATCWRVLCDIARFTLIAVALLAARGEASNPEPAESPAQRKVFLWAVSPAGAAQATKLFLFGSTHAARRPQENLDPAIEHAFAAADVLAVEVDTLRTPAGQIAREADALGRIQDGGTLGSQLPPELYEEARAALGSQGMAPDSLDPYEPWFASLLISGGALSRLGYHPSFGVEEYFLHHAQSKRIVELEGAGAQLRLLDELSPELQRAMLEQTLQGLPGLGSRIAALSAAWRAGDAAGLGALTFAAAGSPPTAQRLDELMYYARNRGMADKLEGAMRAGGTWFAVIGAAHMAGERGLPALFAQRGYRVRQLAALGAEPQPEPADERPVGLAVLR